MRKGILLLLALALLLCACEREPLTDPVMFCAQYNRAASQPIDEADAYLRTDGEVLLFAGNVLVRLKTNDDGAIHTAVVTGPASRETAAAASDAFTVLAKPFSDDVPQDLIARCAQPALTVRTAETKRFNYAVFGDGETVTIVQTNRLLSSIPVQPSLRLSESE